MSITVREELCPGVVCQLLAIIILLMIFNRGIFAQEPPPRPVDVTVTQNLGFGAFAHGMAGGTVTVNPGGTRSSSGDVILLNLGFSFSAALFELTASQGTVISLLNGPDVTLTGSNGGSMTLHIGLSDPASPFVITTQAPSHTNLNIGGTLTVKSSALNPPGNYSGSFEITFIQE